jgi:flavin-dependent dehydrogenase
MGVYPAFLPWLSRTAGDGWIAVGDAAVALDPPLGGQGVAPALETAFRAFEAARSTRLGAGWARTHDALMTLDRHLVRRAVHEEAVAMLADAFFSYQGVNRRVSFRERRHEHQSTSLAGSGQA